MANRKNTQEKFWSLVNKTDSCWDWAGTLWASGYGRFIFNGKSDRAHRVSWVLSGKSLLPEDCILHRCDNRKCCNPDHLFIGTRAENNYDKTIKGRQSKGEDFARAVLKETDIIEIRSSVKSIDELMVIYGVSWSHINNIKRFRKWKHVQAAV